MNTLPSRLFRLLVLITAFVLGMLGPRLAEHIYPPPREFVVEWEPGNITLDLKALPGNSWNEAFSNGSKLLKGNGGGAILIPDGVYNFGQGEVFDTSAIGGLFLFSDTNNVTVESFRLISQ